MDETFGLFPVPLLRAPGVLGPRLVGGLVQHFLDKAVDRNRGSDALAHTEILRPDESPWLVEAAALITPKIVDVGAMMFGQRLNWAIKEMWVNVLDPGGSQPMHNHANSFVSGIVYLTPTHPDSNTVFIKSPGGTDFVFKNDRPGMSPTPFNAERWVGPGPMPGDVVLFPSYLMHAVPPNAGERRITLAFNAIPGSLDSWGYRIGFNA